jgi:hypothetical protein
MSKKQLALSVMFRLKKFQTALGKAPKRYLQVAGQKTK